MRECEFFMNNRMNRMGEISETMVPKRGLAFERIRGHYDHPP